MKAAGGLAIIGTERHESRRVDRQLRGRAGRQGDPGSSVFFVSFEDTVMRLFANDRVVKMLDRLGFKEGEMIENSMVTKSIENAQKRVEENNFGIRKRLVEYDDVMNAQRRGVYSRRQNALKGERIGVDIANMVYELSDSLASTRFDSFESFSEELNSLFAIEVPFTEAEYGKLDEQEISARIAESVLATMERKKEKLCAEIMPYVKDFVEEKGAKGPIGVPMTDGRRMFNIRADIEECYNNGCKPLAKAWEKAVLLSSIDSCWQEQLREMDELRKAVQNATYEQKDPLVIYKIEAYNIWEKMLVEMNSKSVSTLMRGRKAVPDYEDSKAAEKAAEEARRKQEEERRRRPVYAQPRNASITQAPAGGVPNPYAGYSTTRETYEGETAQRQAAMNANRGGRPVTQPIKAQPKVGRNDPCPCGSGKKYKNCCGRGQ